MSSNHNQAVTLARQGQYERAAEMLQQLHAINPHDAGDAPWNVARSMH
jgi:Flp pilus assembly protein TadD